MNGIIIEKTNSNKLYFESLLWVLRARSKDNIRKPLQGIYSDGTGYFVATDGILMNVVYVPSFVSIIPKGIWTLIPSNAKYIVLMELIGSEYKYPNWKGLIDNFNNSSSPFVCGEITYSDKDKFLWDYYNKVNVPCDTDRLLNIFKGMNFPMLIRINKDKTMIEFSTFGKNYLSILAAKIYK